MKTPNIDAATKKSGSHNKNRQTKQNELIFQLKSMVDALPADVYWKEVDGRWAGLNQHCIESLKKMGFIPEAHESHVIGKTDYDLFDKQNADAYRKNDMEVMKKRIEITREEATQLPNGEIVTLLSNKKPFLDKDNNIIGIIGTSIDISDRKKMEAALQEAKNTAEVANEAKSEFLRNMEHQLRTPFSGVYSMVQILAETETEPQKKQMLEMTYQSAKEFLDLLNNIIDFSRYQVDNRAVLAKKIDLRKTIEKAVTMEKAAAAIKKLDLIYEYPEDIPTVFLSDENRIERIILNLLSNAIKFTDKGYVHVQVKLAKELDDKNLILQIIVSDTGIGIPLDKQQYIYEKFYRISPANQNKYAGSGLGLHIVKQLIEDLEGEIEVVSSPNKGSVFTCTLALKRPLLEVMPDNNSA